MKKIERTMLGGTLLVASLPLLASGPAPEDILIRNYPQHFISYDSSSTGAAVESLEYTVQVNTAPDVDNVYYFLQQWFKPPQNQSGSQAGAQDEVYYSGIQPHVDGTVGFRFSNFVAGSVPKNNLCRTGADGAASGVTCALDKVPYTPGGKYTIKIQKTEVDKTTATYKGTVTDRTTGINYTIGEWSVPLATTGPLNSYFSGFIERYGIPKGSNCGIIPLVNVEYSDILYNGTRKTTKINLRHIKPVLDGSNIHTCTGVPHSTSASATLTDTGYIIKNSDQ